MATGPQGWGDQPNNPNQWNLNWENQGNFNQFNS
jgi:hypothetical protein